MSKIFLFKQAERQLEYRAEHLNKKMFRNMIAWMRSDMSASDSYVEEARLKFGSHEYYFCIERADMGPGEHVYQVWGLNTADMMSREISGEKRIIIEKEVLR